MFDSDGFLLDRNKFDILPLDPYFGHDIFSEVEKRYLADAGYFG